MKTINTHFNKGGATVFGHFNKTDLDFLQEQMEIITVMANDPNHLALNEKFQTLGYSPLLRQWNSCNTLAEGILEKLNKDKSLSITQCKQVETLSAAMKKYDPSFFDEVEFK